jgi:hypothetical protein
LALSNSKVANSKAASFRGRKFQGCDPISMQTPNHRQQAQIFHEKVKLHRNTLNEIPLMEAFRSQQMCGSLRAVIRRVREMKPLGNATNGEAGTTTRLRRCPAFHLA